MKRIMLSAAALVPMILPVAAHATPRATETRQAICVPVIVDTPDGPVEGLLCLPQGGVL